MAAARRSEVVGSTAFPPYTVRMVGDRHFLIAGGGGQAKTGVANTLEIYSLQRDQSMCVAEKVFRYDTGLEPIMNCTVLPDGKSFVLAAGQGDSCHVYELVYKVVVPKREGEDGVRKRKGNLTDSSSYKSAEKKITFDIDTVKTFQTDFHQNGGFQKAIQVSPDLSILATGGADGCLRVWQCKSFKKLYEVKAHKNEIDDVAINHSGTQVTTVSRDSHGYVWNLKDGSLVTSLNWEQSTDCKYRYRACRYGRVSDRPDEERLFTLHIPKVQSQSSRASFITKWNSVGYRVSATTKIGGEILCAMAISDDGTYLGVGTISGSVAIYVAFSLQRIYHVKQAHSIFVTGMTFTPTSTSSRAITGDFDCTLLSISADNQIKIHQVPSRASYSALWVLIGFVLFIYIAFWLISSVGL